MEKIVVCDGFAGLGGEARRPIVESMGFELITFDKDPSFNCTITADIMDMKSLPPADFYWMSPDCSTWSVVRMGANWIKENGMPRTDEARFQIKLVRHMLDLLIKSGKPFAIENPMGKLRKMPFMQEFELHEISYCQYGGKYQKPTDIWTRGFKWQHKPRCKRGAPCHIAAPRGSTTGTQGSGTYAEKSVVPTKLWIEILNAVRESLT